jgi:hypothetical protein
MKSVFNEGKRYFGSEISHKANSVLAVAPVRLSERSVRSAGSFTLETYVSGGQPPFTYGIGLDKDDVDATEPVERGGWIEKTITTPQVTAEKSIRVHLVVLDSVEGRVDSYSTVEVMPQ